MLYDNYINNNDIENNINKLSLENNNNHSDNHKSELEIKIINNLVNDTWENDYTNNIIIDDNIIDDNIIDDNIIDDNIIDDNIIDNNTIESEEYEIKIKKNLIDEDAWDNYINDNKIYINNKIARIFPLIKNYNSYSKLKIDDDSFSYITVREIADIITKIISYHLLYFNLNPQKMTIIDYTSGVGGNVLSFSKYFNFVYAVEIDETRANYLENNINIYGYTNVEVINESAIEFNINKMIKINPNVIFMDPPWGGNDYKNNDKLLLKLGNKCIEEFVEEIIKIFSEYYLQNQENIKKSLNLKNKLIVLKLPKNYDIEFFYNYINDINVKNYKINTYLYILNKMIIIICELQSI